MPKQMSPKTCVKCSKVFVPRPTRPNQKFCSLQCAGKAKLIAPPTFICEHCGKETVRRRLKMANGQRLGYEYKSRFCSRECGYKGRKWRPISEIGYVADSGYRMIHLRGGKKILQHRKIMAETLGRPLTKDESVHHKNGDRLDNRPENLELWSRYQPYGQRVTDKVTFAIEILRLYPEFAKAAGVVLHDLPVTDEFLFRTTPN